MGYRGIHRDMGFSFGLKVDYIWIWDVGGEVDG